MHIRIRYGVLFKRILILLCIVFVVEMGYFGKCMWNRRRYIASLDIPKGFEGLPEDMLVAEEPEPAMQDIFYKAGRNRALSIEEILDSRDPFSDVTFREGAERQRAKELDEFWSQRYYSILREDTKRDTDIVTFAYIIKERPPLPPPVLDEIEIEGIPKESLRAPVKQESPFKWKGTLIAKEQAYHFLGNEKKDYAVVIGERAEGYTLQKEEGKDLLLEKDGEMYAVERK